MSNEEDLNNLDITIEQAKKVIHRRKLLIDLESSPAFKELFIDGYLKDFAVRQVMLKSHPGLQEDAQQKMLDQNIIAIGCLKQYLISLNTEGLNAEQALSEDEETREAILAEDLTNSCGGFS